MRILAIEWTTYRPLGYDNGQGLFMHDAQETDRMIPGQQPATR